MPKLTIAIPSYNGSDTIEYCIESILSTEFEDIEVLVGEDGSTDNTAEIISKYDDPRYRYYENEENLGHDKNLIKITQEASGEYVCYLSDEDILIPSGLSKIMEVTRNMEDLSLIYGNVFDLRKGGDGMYYDENESYWRDTNEALLAHAKQIPGGSWGHSYIAGTTVKRESVDIDKAKEYIGCGYMAAVFAWLSITDGGMYWVDEPVCAMGYDFADRRNSQAWDEDGEKISAQSAEARVIQSKYRTRLFDSLNIDDSIKKELLQKEKANATQAIWNKNGYNIKGIKKDCEEHPINLDVKSVIRSRTNVKGALRNRMKKYGSTLLNVLE